LLEAVQVVSTEYHAFWEIMGICRAMLNMALACVFVLLLLASNVSARKSFLLRHAGDGCKTKFQNIMDHYYSYDYECQRLITLSFNSTGGCPDTGLKSPTWYCLSKTEVGMLSSQSLVSWPALALLDS
jgi:hypothetical protein